MSTEEQSSGSRSDVVLRPFLLATDEEEAQQLLSSLLSDHVEPIARSIIRRKLSISHAGGSPRSEDVDDIYGTVLVPLLTRLQRARANSDAGTINDFRGYVAVISYNVCHQHLREKYPQRCRLKNRLRYLLTHDATFTLWESAEADWLCGLAPRKGQIIELERTKSLESLRDNPAELERTGVSINNLPLMRLADLVAAILRWAGASTEVDDLVKTVAQLQGIKDHPVVTTEDDPNAPDRLPDRRPSVESEVERRRYLQRLWEEIQELPLRQRNALLLNLRDEQEGVLALLPLMGLASIRQLADTLAIPSEQFALLWNELPWEDALIAEHLGVTRQQVINLRKSARARLARRMRAFDEGH